MHIVSLDKKLLFQADFEYANILTMTNKLIHSEATNRGNIIRAGVMIGTNPVFVIYSGGTISHSMSVVF